MNAKKRLERLELRAPVGRYRPTEAEKRIWTRELMAKIAAVRERLLPFVRPFTPEEEAENRKRLEAYRRELEDRIGP